MDKIFNILLWKSVILPIKPFFSPQCACKEPNLSVIVVFCHCLVFLRGASLVFFTHCLSHIFTHRINLWTSCQRTHVVCFCIGTVGSNKKKEWLVWNKAACWIYSPKNATEYMHTLNNNDENSCSILLVSFALNLVKWKISKTCLIMSPLLAYFYEAVPHLVSGS